MYKYLFILLLLASCKKSTTEKAAPVPVDSLPATSGTTKDNLKASLAYGSPSTVWSTNPITYTIEDTSSTITGGIRIMGGDKKLTYTNVRTAVKAIFSDYVKGQAADYGTATTVNPQGIITSSEFIFSGTQFEFLMFGGGGSTALGNVYIEIDNKLANDTGFIAPSITDNVKHFVKVSFGSPVVNRHVKIILSGFRAFGGLVTDPAATVSAYIPPTRTKAVIIGDSYTAGTGTNYQLINYYAYKLGKLLGWNNNIISGVGGTGYLNPGNNRKTYHQRLDDVVSASPDAVVITGGLNDIKYASAGAVGTEALSYFKDIRTALPNAEIFVVGPFYTNGATYPAALRDTIKGAALQVNAHFIDVTGWITGTGWQGHENGTGNSDYYIWTDATHPTVLGHDYLASKLYTEIKNIINTY